MPPPTSPIGCVGHVTRHGAIRPGRVGEVMVAVGGGMQAFLAHDADGGAIDALEEIVVIDRVAERTVLVTRLNAPIIPSPARRTPRHEPRPDRRRRRGHRRPDRHHRDLKGLYKVPAADQALIITGGGTKGQTAGTEGRTYKIVTGGGALVIPVLQKAQYLSMKADKAILDVEGVDSQKIPVGVRGVAIFKVGDDEQSITNAATRFLHDQDAAGARPRRCTTWSARCSTATCARSSAACRSRT